MYHRIVHLHIDFTRHHNGVVDAVGAMIARRDTVQIRSPEYRAILIVVPISRAPYHLRHPHKIDRQVIGRPDKLRVILGRLLATCAPTSSI
jgi:hypothetical protein